MRNAEETHDLRDTKNKIAELLDRVDRLAILDSRTADNIIGYDENGTLEAETPKSVFEAPVSKPEGTP